MHFDTVSCLAFFSKFRKTWKRKPNNWRRINSDELNWWTTYHYSVFSIWLNKTVVNVYKRWSQPLNEKQHLIDSVLQLIKVFFKKVENMLQINLWKKYYVTLHLAVYNVIIYRNLRISHTKQLFNILKFLNMIF